MLPCHKDGFRRNRVILVRELIVDDEFLAFCEQEEILTDAMSEEIKVKPTKGGKATAFLDLIHRRGPRAMKVFVMAAVETGQEHLAGKVEPDMTREYQAEHNKNGVPVQIEGNRPVQIEGNRPQQETPKQHVSMFSSSVTDSNPLNSSLMTDPPVPISQGDADRLRNDRDVYKMTSKPRGHAMIINNEYFMRRDLGTREGSVFDGTNIECLLKNLGFTTELLTDKTKQEIMDKLSRKSKDKELIKGDAFVLCLMTHGTRGYIYGTDGGKLSIEQDILTTFDEENCPQLRGKPKIFLIQACQGSIKPARTESDAESSAADAWSEELSNKVKELSLEDTPSTVPGPTQSDMIVAYSTVPGYKAFRRTDAGSWFIKSIVSVFQQCCYKEHAWELLTGVRRLVSEQRTDEGHTQLTETKDTLKKKLYFFPGYWE